MKTVTSTVPAPAEQAQLDTHAERYMALPAHPEGTLRAYIHEHRLDRGEFIAALERWRDARRADQ